MSVSDDAVDDNVDLDVLESNELIFNVTVEGASVTPKARMVVENKDFSYSFEGKPISTNNVAFFIPEGIINEGCYPSRIEVIVGNKILIPFKFSTTFKGFINSSSDIVETTAIEQSLNANVTMLPIKTQKTDRGKQVPVISEKREELKESLSVEQVKDLVVEAVKQFVPQQVHYKNVITTNSKTLKDRWLNRKK